MAATFCRTMRWLRMNSGKTFLTELSEVGLRNCKVVPRRMTSGLESTGCARFCRDSPSGFRPANAGLRRYATTTPCARHRLAWLWMNLSTTGRARMRATPLRVIAEAEAAHMLSSAGSTPNIHRQPVTVRTGFRGNARDDTERTSWIAFSGSRDRMCG